ncbi:MAG: LON peptidase substrate-binding domain-containing protein [Acidimicrobiales bacterium]
MVDPFPMFPLGTVLFPSLVLPLHIFEPRYRAMVKHCLDGEPEFGVVLIERGSEVGGDDVRTDVGTVARIAEAAALPDGRYVLAAVGTRRIRVLEWLTDDPWPQAAIADFGDTAEAGAGSGERWVRCRAVLKRVLALATELGQEVPPLTIEPSDEPSLGSFQAAALAPLGPADRQRVLAAPGVDDRLDVLDALLAEHEEFLNAQLRA